MHWFRRSRPLGHRALRSAAAVIRRHISTNNDNNESNESTTTLKQSPCLTTPSGTRGLVPTAKVLEPVESAPTKLASSGNTDSTSVDNAFVRKLQTLGLSSIGRKLLFENREELWFYERYLRGQRPCACVRILHDLAQLEKKKADAKEKASAAGELPEDKK